MIDLDTLDNINNIAQVMGRLYKEFVSAGLPVPVAENMVQMYWADQLEEAHK